MIGLRLSGNRTAAGRHIEYLLHEWSGTAVPFDRIVLLTRGAVELGELGVQTRVEVHSFGEKLPRLVWEQVAAPIEARRSSVLFCPSYVGPLLRFGPLAVANHGIYARIPDEFPRLQRLRSTPLQHLSARFATRVIANSGQTRDDIIEFFNVRRERVEVVYPAANRLFFETHEPDAITETVQAVIGTDAPYLIFVGKLARRRNVPNLIRAFARVRRDYDLPHHLLVVGPNTSGVPIDDLCAEEGLDGAVIYRPHLEQELLARLYAGAAAFVLPTTYEGISYTMFEAMASGTPVLTVDHPTIHEGPGSAVLAARSAEVDDLVAGLVQILLDDELRQELGERGRISAARFSWTNAARSTMDVLDRIAKAHDRR